MYYVLRTFARRLPLVVAITLVSLTIHCQGQNQSDEGRNILIGLLGAAAGGCASYGDTAISNPLFTGGGLRTRYEVSTCDAAGWTNLGFAANGGVDRSVASTRSLVVTQSPESGFGTSIEVTFETTASSGSLDVMAYGSQDNTGGFTSTSPMMRLNLGTACSASSPKLLQFRNNGGSIADVSKCDDAQTILSAQTYTYCLEFDRGTGSGGSYTGFANMLAAWSRPCADVAQVDRDQMADVKLMQMMSLPAMNPGTSGTIGFAYSGVRLRSFRIGSTIYASMM